MQKKLSPVQIGKMLYSIRLTMLHISRSIFDIIDDRRPNGVRGAKI